MCIRDSHIPPHRFAHMEILCNCGPKRNRLELFHLKKVAYFPEKVAYWVKAYNHSSTPHEKKSTPAIAWCPESRFRLSWLASSINTIRGADILPRLLLLQQPVKVTRCGLQWLFPTKKMAVLPYCGYSYVLAFATRMFPGLAVRSLLNFRCLAFVLKVGVKVVVILVV